MKVFAKGFSQRPEINFFDTFARLNFMRTLIALAAETGREIMQLDITTAYLNGKIDVEINDLLEDMLQKIIHDEADTKLVPRVKDMLGQLRRGSVCKLKTARRVPQ